MKKSLEVLCTDLGCVLMIFDGAPLEQLIKEGRRDKFLDLVHKHDRDLIAEEQLLEESNRNCFKEQIFWTDFLQLYDRCLAGINAPMFNALRRLKESQNTKLVCITDISRFAFLRISLKFPEIFELFRDTDACAYSCNGIGNWVRSYELKALKRDLTPFIRAQSSCGFSLKNAGFIDDRKENLDAFVKCGGSKSACFLYRLGDPKNQSKFEKFLEKHFPPK